MSNELFPRNTFQRLMDTIAFVAAVQQYIDNDRATFPYAMQLGLDFELKSFVTAAKLNDRYRYVALCQRFHIPSAVWNRVWIDYAPQHGHYVPFEDAHNRGWRI